MSIDWYNRIHKFLCTELGAVECLDHTGSIRHNSCRLANEAKGFFDSVVVEISQLIYTEGRDINLSFSRWGFAMVLGGGIDLEVVRHAFGRKNKIFIKISESGAEAVLILNGFDKNQESGNPEVQDGMQKLENLIRCRKTKPKKIALAFIGIRTEERHGLFISETQKQYETEIWEREKKFSGFYNSFSQIVNESVVECDSEFIFWIHPRVKVDFDMLDELLLLLCSGYAFVSEINFGFFGCSKQLFRKIGLLDERFIGSEQEDTDWFFRMKMHSIPSFERGNTAICPDEPHVWGPLRGLSHTLFEEKWIRVYDELYSWEWPYDWSLSKFYDQEKKLLDGKSREDIEDGWLGVEFSHGTSFIPRLSLSCVFHDNVFDEKYVTTDATIKVRINNNRLFVELECPIKTFMVVTVHDSFSKVIANIRVVSNRWVETNLAYKTENDIYEVRINCGQYRVFHGFMVYKSEQLIKTGIRIKTSKRKNEKEPLKIHIPQPIDPNSEMNLLIMPALLRSSEVSLVDESESAELVLYHHSGGEFNYMNFSGLLSKRSIMIDYQDDPHKIIEGEWSYYFKRSTADKSANPPKRIQYNKDFPVIHLPYCVKEMDGRTGFDYPRKEKEFDVCCMFELLCPHENRRKVVNFVEGLRRKGLKVFTGLVDWHFLRRTLCDEYFDIMLKSKIIVTCNPQEWEGDYRLFEALTTGSLVFCDMMSDRMGLDQEVVWYDVNNLDAMERKIKYYLNNPEELERISQSAYQKTKSDHTSDARVKFILETIIQK